MPAAAISFDPKVGALVNVASRTWPGINKPGGVGKVLGITIQDGVTYVDVEYVLGGKEKAVEIEFVKEHKFDEENHGRPARSRRSRCSKDASESVEKKINLNTKKTIKTALENVSNKNSRDGKRKVNKRKISSTSKTVKAKEPKGNNKSQTKRSKISKETKIDSAVDGSNDNKRADENGATNQTNNVLKNASPSPGFNSSSHSEVTPSRLTGFLKNVYSDMSKKAASFVENVIGKAASQPSSPESMSSGLEIKPDKDRDMKFDTTFFDVVRKKMVDCIELDELMSEVNTLNQEEPFTELEIRTHLQRLDKDCKIMVTWDTGTVYMV